MRLVVADAAIDRDDLSGNKACHIRRKPQHGSCNIIRHAFARQQYMALDHVELRFAHLRPGDRAEDQTGQHRIAANIRAAELRGRIAGQRIYRRFGRAIGRVQYISE